MNEVPSVLELVLVKIATEVYVHFCLFNQCFMFDHPFGISFHSALGQLLQQAEHCARWRADDAVRFLFDDLRPGLLAVLHQCEVPAVRQIK